MVRGAWGPGVRLGAWAALVVAIVGCDAGPRGDAIDTGPESGQPAAAPATLVWRALGAWTGQGSRQTESFEVSSGALRLVWQAEAPEGDGGATLRVSLHSAISGRPLATIVDHAGAGADTVRFASGQRVAYLLVESAGVVWRLVLEEGVALDR